MSILYAIIGIILLSIISIKQRKVEITPIQILIFVIVLVLIIQAIPLSVDLETI